MERKQDIKIAREIIRLRLSQLLINEKYKANAFKIPIHIAIGHEAIAVAVDTVMGKKDLLTCTHRNMHYNLARTKLIKPILDEYFLKKDGLAGAELGSMNLANEKKNIVYTSSILGNNLPVAAGLALGQKVKHNNAIVIVQTGDGAMEEGTFYESLLCMKSNSLAGLVIVENNEWSMHTRISERRTAINLSKFAESLGVGYKKLRGNDVYLYINELKKIRKHILKNKVPFVLEVNIVTLGGWYVEVEGNVKGRYIHPHAGPLSKTNIEEWPEIEHSSTDPVFVLNKHFQKDTLKAAAKKILKDIKAEIGGN